MMFEVTRDPLELQSLLDLVKDPSHGAVLGFLGVVRDHSGDREVEALDYSAYREMAEEKMQEIARDLQEEYGPLCIVARHRIGVLRVGEASLALAVGAPHRKEALLAIQVFIDRLKEIVPIWKKDIPAKEEKRED